MVLVCICGSSKETRTLWSSFGAGVMIKDVVGPAFALGGLREWPVISSMGSRGGYIRV